ncbi:hypothetical protein CPB83DRAFT_846479 [Crepidotus variabilis]|uniref:DUF7918 domain-containing protein n=1 Tax=Crepidotus variabilis TaxID=179855 RepID=A0A9P6JUU8_9AGAR|nr:hypothetical protein CPB83DRAFT_846479 [Crepidotus variabilis]
MNPYHSIPSHSRLQVGQLTCWIEGTENPKVIGNPRPELDGNVFSCWIESVAGQVTLFLLSHRLFMRLTSIFMQEFTVNWHNNHRDVPLEGRLYLDGVHCDTQFMPERNHKPDAFWSTVVMDCAQISDQSRSTFHFSDLQDDEDEDEDHTGRVLDGSQIGAIRLEVRRIQLANHIPVVYVNNIGKSLGRATNLTDVTLHRTSLGKAYDHPQRRLIGTKAKNLDNNPWHTFIFRYRPLSFLVKYNLMPSWYTTPQPTNDQEECLTPTRPYAQLSGSSSTQPYQNYLGQNLTQPSSTKRKRDDI